MILYSIENLSFYFFRITRDGTKGVSFNTGDQQRAYFNNTVQKGEVYVVSGVEREKFLGPPGLLKKQFLILRSKKSIGNHFKVKIFGLADGSVFNHDFKCVFRSKY